MDDAIRVIEASGLEDYFRQEIQSVFHNQRVQAHPNTEFYLVRLLSDFGRSDQLYSSEQEDQALAILYLQSIQDNGLSGLRLLKQIADFALYISGFFQDSLQRQNIDLSYYVAMGGNAYRRLHSRARDTSHGESFAETFRELSQGFVRFVDVLAEISERSKLTTDVELLRLYEKWLCTKSERLKAKLRSLGIDPLHLDFPSTRH
ncbi:MAG TPA: hypothetical protein VJR29_01995 [bacterium]|nr:hypothetical protein [bacterium]